MDIDPVDVDETLATTRAVRRRLDFERPVDNQYILHCIEATSDDRARSFQAVNEGSLSAR